jgi:hypothetical protein
MRVEGEEARLWGIGRAKRKIFETSASSEKEVGEVDLRLRPCFDGPVRVQVGMSNPSPRR